MSSVIELSIPTGSLFQVCIPKYVADLKKHSVFGVANGKTGALCMSQVLVFILCYVENNSLEIYQKLPVF